MPKLKVCKCDCHEDTLMSCMDLVCSCCPYHNIRYMHSGKVNAETYATLVAKRAVELYRARNTYFEFEFHTKPRYQVQNLVNVSSFNRDGFERFGS